MRASAIKANCPGSRALPFTRVVDLVLNGPARLINVDLNGVINDLTLEGDSNPVFFKAQSAILLVRATTEKLLRAGKINDENQDLIFDLLYTSKLFSYLFLQCAEDVKEGKVCVAYDHSFLESFDKHTFWNEYFLRPYGLSANDIRFIYISGGNCFSYTSTEEALYFAGNVFKNLFNAIALNPPSSNEELETMLTEALKLTFSETVDLKHGIEINAFKPFVAFARRVLAK